MDIVLSFFKIVGTAVLAAARFIMSLRSKGVEFNPYISDNHDGTYTVEAFLMPGKDEVFFDTFIARGCDIALGYKQAIKSPFNHDKIKIRVLVQCRKTTPNECCVNFVIRPRTGSDSVRFVIKGGWLNQLSSTRYLPNRNYTN